MFSKGPVEKTHVEVACEKKLSVGKPAAASIVRIEPIGAGYRAADIRMSDEQRINLMNMVKQGGMTQDEALDIVLRPQYTKKEIILPSYNINTLSDADRSEVIQLVKNGNISIDDAYMMIKKKSRKPDLNSQEKDKKKEQDRLAKELKSQV